MQIPALDANSKLFEYARKGSQNIPRFKSSSLQSVWEQAYPLFAFFYAGLIPFLSAFCAAPIIVLNIAIEGFSPEILRNPINLNSPLITTMFLVFSFSPIFLFVWGWLVVFEKRIFWTTGLTLENALKNYSFGMLIGFGMIAIPVSLKFLVGSVDFESNPNAWEGWVAVPGVLILLVGWIVQGAAEETLTRGFLLPIFGVRLGPAWGILISSMLFAALHLLNDNLGLIALLNLFLFGVFASLYAIREGGLWGVFAIHSIWNWAQGNVFGLEVSGEDFGATTIFNLKETGLDLLTGGLFGPEGGLIVTMVLIIGCLVIYYQSVYKRKILQST